MDRASPASATSQQHSHAADAVGSPVPSPSVSAVDLTPEQKWQIAWCNVFGIASAQVYFPDQELQARVYTLDSDTGYKVQNKTVNIADPIIEPEPLPADDGRSLNFPKKARMGENHGRARLKKDDIHVIRSWAKAYFDRNEIPPWTAKAEELKVSEGTLRDIYFRRTWGHIA